ncbi:MAG: sulfite exporter TauE/SafE family protein [Candidatus Tectimicrobiota bacterium]
MLLSSWWSIQASVSLIQLLESLVAGGLTGFLSGLLGVGGGFIMIPLLTLMGTPIHTAVGTCLAFVACSSLATLLQHIRQGSIDPLVALTMTIPAALFANIGAHFASTLAPATLHILFGCLLIAIMLMYHFAPATHMAAAPTGMMPSARRWYLLQRQRAVRDHLLCYEFHLPKALLSGIATGLLAGFFGIGGGVFLVPLLVVILHVPLPITAGTTLAIFLLPAIVGSVTHWRLGHVDIGLWIPLVLAGILGGQLGARYVVCLSAVLIKRLFLLMVASGALFMLSKGLREMYERMP